MNYWLLKPGLPLETGGATTGGGWGMAKLFNRANRVARSAAERPDCLAPRGAAGTLKRENCAEQENLAAFALEG